MGPAPAMLPHQGHEVIAGVRRAIRIDGTAVSHDQPPSGFVGADPDDREHAQEVAAEAGSKLDAGELSARSHRSASSSAVRSDDALVEDVVVIVGLLTGGAEVDAGSTVISTMPDAVRPALSAIVYAKESLPV